jgi:uncharacterized protein YbaA (DUF1428 family)
MTYIQGFVAAVHKDKKAEYLAHAKETADIFIEFGATRCVENWADDVPHGQRTDFYRAVEAKDDEIIVFSYVEYPDRAAYDRANQQMMTDPRMQNLEMPFDGARMIFGGFETIFDQGK